MPAPSGIPRAHSPDAPTAGRTPLLLAACLALSACTTYYSTAAPEREPAGEPRPARYYQAQLAADDGTLIRFTVYQPALAPGATAPLILHTHGFGLHRMSRPHFDLYATFLEPGKAARLAWQRGYWVISYDQRGHGDSGDVAHVIDPAREGRDVTTLLDWATRHLALTAVDGDPRVGMLGESYAGGIQGIASALDPRIDAVIPITTWYDLDAALVPNDVPKSAWLTTLITIGNLLARLEPSLDEGYRTAMQGRDGSGRAGGACRPQPGRVLRPGRIPGGRRAAGAGLPRRALPGERRARRPGLLGAERQGRAAHRHRARAPGAHGPVVAVAEALAHGVHRQLRRPRPAAFASCSSPGSTRS